MGTIAMKVARLCADPVTNMPVVVLAAPRGRTEVSIYIGLVEAAAIASELEKIPLQRPMTHDLMKTLLAECGGKVAQVTVRDLRGDTFYASILVERAGQAPVEVDARPSDAIALALRSGAPIRVAREVVERAKAAPADAARARGAEGGDPALYRELLETLSDEAFGKWKM